MKKIWYGNLEEDWEESPFKNIKVVASTLDEAAEAVAKTCNDENAFSGYYIFIIYDVTSGKRHRVPVTIEPTIVYTAWREI